MDKETKNRLTENLIEVKEFADKYPLNAGWAWASKRLGAALEELVPKEEPKPEPSKEAEKPTTMPKTEEEQIAETAPVPVEPEPPLKPETAAEEVKEPSIEPAKKEEE